MTPSYLTAKPVIDLATGTLLKLKILILCILMVVFVLGLPLASEE